MKINVYDQEGKEVGQALLPKEIFGLKVNPDIIHEVLVSQTANRRQVSAHTKGRGEVSGGGKKPWAQKGTGRARHGSNRSPLWRHGGTTFGPTNEKNFKKKINKKIRIKALLMVLSGKAQENQLVLLDGLKFEKPKAKLMFNLFNKLACKGQTVLLALPNNDKNTILSARNLAKTKIIQTSDLNVLDLLNAKYLVMLKDSIKVLKDMFIKDIKEEKE
jgi:large subunit ribosomal protein L4